MKPKALAVDDSMAIRTVLETILENNGYDVVSSENFDGALNHLRTEPFDVVFADIILGGKTGIDILQEVKNMGLNCPVVLITGAPSVNTAAEAVRLGAFDYIPKPFNSEVIARVAASALRHKELNDRLNESRRTVDAILRSVTDGIVTVDNDMHILQANEASRSICGIGPENVGALFRCHEGECSDACMGALNKTILEQQAVHSLRIECSFEGRSRIMNLSTYPLRYEGEAVAGAVMVFKDETRLYELERDLMERRSFHNIIGKSTAMQEIYNLIERLSDVESTVLLLGESGTGKELVAEALHYSGRRASGPLVKVNCSALSEPLLESELFGHVKGAFTGAIQDKPGKFELADGGTLFLDEIGDISPLVQVKLLRVLQDLTVERVGGTTSHLVDVRVVAATNRDLYAKVQRGEFREDLYYRLKVVEMRLPALRERKEDIPLMVEYFLSKFSQKLGKRIESVSTDVMRAFMEHSWPGNVRELQHALEYACILASGPVISIDNLPRDFGVSSARSAGTNMDISDEAAIKRNEIVRALEASGWKKARAARMLGISRMTIYRKMEEYHITSE